MALTQSRFVYKAYLRSRLSATTHIAVEIRVHNKNALYPIIDCMIFDLGWFRFDYGKALVEQFHPLRLNPRATLVDVQGTASPKALQNDVMAVRDCVRQENCSLSYLPFKPQMGNKATICYPNESYSGVSWREHEVIWHTLCSVAIMKWEVHSELSGISNPR